MKNPLKIILEGIKYYVDDLSTTLTSKIDNVKSTIPTKLSQLSIDEEIPEENIPDTIARVSDVPDEQVQADWSTADTSSKAYIKNKTHYVNIRTLVSFDGNFDNLTPVTIGEYEYYRIGYSISRSYIDGYFNKFYFQRYRGPFYAIDKNEIIHASDGDIWEYNPQSSPTIRMISVGSDNCDLTEIGYDGVVIEDAGLYVVKLDYYISEIYSYEYRPLDEKYIPETIARLEDIPEQVQADWNEQDSSSKAYIKNKTHSDSYQSMLTFDGNFTDLPSVVIGDYTYYRIGDYRIRKSYFLYRNYVVHIVRHNMPMSSILPEDVILDPDKELWKWYDSGAIIAVGVDNCDLTSIGYDGVIVEKSGIYVADTDYYISELGIRTYRPLLDPYIPDSIARVEDVPDEQVQADWNENTETSKAHILNRTHYVSDEMVTVFENEEIYPKHSTVYGIDEIPEKYLVDGGEFKFIYTLSDGNIIEFVGFIAKANDDYEFILDMDTASGTIANYNVSTKRLNQYYTGDVRTLTLQVAEYKQLDIAFIPNTIARMSDIPEQVQANWDTEDTSSKTYIRGRTHYRYQDSLLTFDGNFTDLPSVVIDDKTYYRIGDYIPKDLLTDEYRVSIMYYPLYSIDSDRLTSVPDMEIWQYKTVPTATMVWLIAVGEDNCDLTPLGYDGVVIEQAGVYCVYYVRSSNEYTGEVSTYHVTSIWKYLYKPLDEVYIPDTILRESELSDAINVALAQAKESGEFNGPQGDKGEKGDKGDPGESYVITDEDKEEIVEMVGGTVIPDYWKDHLAEKADLIWKAMESAGRNKSSFFFYSDAHWWAKDRNDEGVTWEHSYTTKSEPMLLKYLYENTPINKTNFGGDFIGEEADITTEDGRTTMSYIQEWRKALRDIPNHHSVAGNHDDGNEVEGRFSDEFIWSYLFAPEEKENIVYGDGFYYYLDNNAEKTRYLYLDTACKGLDDAQKEFVKQALISTPEEWHIVVIAHKWYDTDYTTSPVSTGEISSEGTTLLSMFDNYNARQGDYVNCTGWVEFCIGGHTHWDYDGTSNNGIPVILVESSSVNDRSGLNPVPNAITETAVSAIIADYNEAKIEIIRIGRGSDREVILVEHKVITYTNVLLTAVDSDGSSIEGGYKENHRISGSSGFSSADGCDTTGWIPCRKGDVIRFYNMTFDLSGGTTQPSIGLYNELGLTMHGSYNYSVLTEDGNSWGTVLDGSNIIQVTIPSFSEMTNDNIYFRVCADDINENTIITINEEIE